jgi:serine/threonine-protein kinase
LDTKQVIACFEAERQALAMMEHPSIAHVHDAGAPESGRPYFVMELVRGVPITEYCDRERLSIPERLELFVQVCRAVQHAHQKGVIHRELKPSNILVTVIDGAPVPRIIDFGVAKATGGSLTERTIYTAFHQFVGTPLYMRPEQADLSGMDVDTRSDIYSLGVLLYELLISTTPFSQDAIPHGRLRRAALHHPRTGSAETEHADERIE